MKHLALLALLPCVAVAAPCPDQSKVSASKRKPCVSWSPVTMRVNGTPLLPEHLGGYTLYWEKIVEGKVERGTVAVGKDTQYFMKNANRNYPYKFWVVTHDTAGQTSESSQTATWGKQ